ncbi:MAG TPA: winged helix-turn-helix transcriptional regulator [Solirubrobacterales bacterium]|nr:winged helix-turn-helix transcriptional regulator [Solirubrobacterales bacterium]
MPESYGQFCPVAQAAEVLTERWTLLVLRELLMGSTRFNELQRGVPRMSSSLLSKRLREMERSGLLTREPLKGERGHAYRLTPAGEALGPLVVSLGNWSREWLKREISEEEADPALLMWDVRRSVQLDRLPQEQLVTFFRYRDAEEGKRAWWLVARPDNADLCFTDPGFAIDLQVDAEAQAMAEVWIGQLELGAAMKAKRLRVSGPEHLVRSLPDWLGFSTFAYDDPAAELARRQA